MQGKTLKNQDIVCYTHPHLPAGCGYVMLSRATDINNVYISNDFDFSKVRPHSNALKEAKQIAESSIATNLKSTNFDIFYINMRAKRRFIDIQHDLFANQSSLVCLVQTCFKPDEVIQWPGRKCMPHASIGDGKGVCCFTKTEQEQENLFRTRVARETFQIIKMTMKNRYQIYVLYLSKDANMEEVVSTLSNLIMDNLEIIIIGDFNFPSKQKNPLTNYLKSTLGLLQTIDRPTYRNGPNIIDHVYMSQYVCNIVDINCKFTYYSDHCSISISFNYNQ